MGTLEYHVMFWSADHEQWFSHTGAMVTDSPEIAAQWLEQAKFRGAYGEPTTAVIEKRIVYPWIPEEQPCTPLS